jgi:hypothetical protein
VSQTKAQKDAEAAAAADAGTTSTTTEATTSEAAPVNPPGSADQVNGLNKPDNSAAAIATGITSATGERHEGLVGEDDQPISLDSALDYGDGTRTYVEVKERIYERYYLAGSTRPMTRLLFGTGARLSREQAEALKAATK